MDPNVGASRILRVKTPKLYDVDPIVDDEIEGKITFSVKEKLKDSKFDITSSPEALLEFDGKDFDLSFIQEHGFNTPLLFKKKDGLGLKVPDPVLFSVNDVKSYVGARRVIDVFDCGTHEPQKMTVHQFVKYYTSEEKNQILNVTSLEFSHTGLDRIVDGPSVVREDLDWVPLVWPKELYDEQKDQTNTIENMKYPKVRKYVLMSVGGCYTDFHIDFGGSSVWYHVLKGSKVFWVIPPTEENLDIFEQWALSPHQTDEFFGDLVEKCYRIHLVAGDTFMIPTGWIHGVYTPEDSLVFGGNFLHSFNIAMQLRVFDLEEATHVPKHLRFPFFVEIHWYMIKTYIEILERDLDERRKLEFEADVGAEEGVFKMLNDEINYGNTTSEEKPKPPKWQLVYLTVYELDGLKQLCERLRSWSYAKSNYPKTLKEDSMELLDRLEEVLQYHEEDDQMLACRGINIFKQYQAETLSDIKSGSPNTVLNSSADSTTGCEQQKDLTPTKKQEPTAPKEERPKRQRKLKEFVKEEHRKIKEKRRKKFLKKEKTIIRRQRCNECEGCSRENCNTCRFCLDMKKNGGLGKLRQSCQMRFCENPQLPGYVACSKCEEPGEGEILMECSICGEIIHPSCSEKKAPCKISRKVNNSWECPKCCQSDDEATEFSMDKVGRVVSSLKQKLLKSSKTDDSSNGRGGKQNEDVESDDEPLSKKRSRKSQENGNAQKYQPVMVQPVTVVRPGPIDSPYIFLVKEDGINHLLHREIWIQAFTYLDEKEINKCMLVCKAWNQWCLDTRLWREICVNNRPLTPSMLIGIVRRQPSRLALSSTGLSGRQLEWLLNRLPRLKSLDLSLNTASAVSALMRTACPPLTHLNLSWCDAIFDDFMTQLLAPIRSGRAEIIGMCRLQFIENLNLTGCDVGTETLNAVFSRLKYLRHLDVSQCSRVKNTDFDIVKNGKSVNKETLKRIICIGCCLVTEDFVLQFNTDNMPSMVRNI